jgi:hypothetical protein
MVGNEPSSRGSKLVYAMQVSEVLDFDAYFFDSRFEYKKPRPGGDWQTQCGDNIYHREDDVWRQEWSPCPRPGGHAAVAGCSTEGP